MPQSRSICCLLFTALLAVAGCSPKPFDELYKQQQADIATNAQDLFASGYFPDSFGVSRKGCYDFETEIVSEVEEEWYPRQWMAAREPSFYLWSESREPPEFALRFSYIPSFTPSIFIRVEKGPSGFRLIAKELSGAGGYDPGSVARSKEVVLSESEAAELENLLTRSAVLDEPEELCGNGFGFDGSQWIVEHIDQDGYGYANRWTPQDGAVRELGLFLLALAGWSARD